MELIVGLAVLAFVGGIIGGLARFAVPGPDPMPTWLMIVIGLIGAFVGGSVGYAAGGELGALVTAVIVASLVLVLYRRFVQKRGLTGPDAQRLPRRGVGIRRMRERWGVDPTAGPEANRLLARLAELRDQGSLTADDYEVLRESLLGRR